MEVFQFFIDNKHKIEQNSEPFGSKGCIKWGGPRSGNKWPQYGRMWVLIPGQSNRKRLHVHRLVYMCHHNILELTPGLHGSHLCHNSLCVNAAHLNLEPQSINNQRQSCGDTCSTHKLGEMDLSNCIV
jgi:hypothetical protein